jgi:outer membrane protein TolC
VATGHVVDIQRELLVVAARRARALQELVRSGNAPAIVATDNERLVLDRRGKLVAAERDFRAAAVALSLYLRDDRGRPWRVAADRLPATLVDPPALPLTSEAADVARALESRPELCRLEAEREAARVDGRLAENQMAPSIYLGGYVAKDLGSGPARLAPTELAASITVEMPLLLRKARGRRDAAEAKVAEVAAVLRRASDRIAAEVREARIDLETARAELALAKRQLEVAKRLELAEREKFAQGASDLVIVNLREIAAAEAARLAVQALAATHKAHAEYVAATGSTL